jgi:regulator of RNase E activity RraA
VEGFRSVEVASVADAMEQLYGQRSYMSHEMRPLAAAKFAGPAVTVFLKK